MQRFNGAHWKEYVENQVRSNFEWFGEVVRSRIVVVFDSIDQEATDLERRSYQQLISTVDVGEENFWGAGEAISNLAYAEASGHHEMLSSMKWATLNLFAAGLYHLTEQHLVDLPPTILRYHQLAEVQWKPRIPQPDQAIAWFKTELGLDMRTLTSWSVIDELRFLANAVKHGDGGSATGLRKLQPHLFVPPYLRTQGVTNEPTRVRTPLFGQAIYVTLEDFVKYHEGSISFWNEIADQFPSLTR